MHLTLVSEPSFLKQDFELLEQVVKVQTPK